MIIKTEYPALSMENPLEKICPISETVLFDIETTGLSPKNASVYLIGALVYKEHSWQLTQWLAETPAEEHQLLSAFMEFLTGYGYLIHFNGDSFDLPFLKNRCRLLSLPCCLENLESIDLYRCFRPLKKLLKLPDMKLKSLEFYLNISREDTMSGKELISIYHHYVQHPDSQELALLLLHNRDDVLGTCALLPLLSYCNLLNGKFRLTQTPVWEKEEHAFTLTITLTLDTPLPKRISLKLDHGYMTAWDSVCRILIHGVCGTLKYFFSDFSNYYYLPQEDTAIHKSVASYVDKEYRIPAKAATCYCKKTGLFLPGNAASSPPFFKRDYKDHTFYQECTSEFLNNPSMLYSYLIEFLKLC